MKLKLFFAFTFLLVLGASCNSEHVSMVPPQQTNPEDDAMRQHCKMMPEMAGCEKYNNLNTNSNNSFIDRSTNNLSEAQPQTQVTLNDGDTYDLTASFVKKDINGKTIRMLAYNNQIPGPILKVKQGSKITINFKNNLDEKTTIHWHGLRLDNQFDGVPDNAGGVAPGGSFTYELKFPDSGFYWYHPHTREDYEQALGLYGLIWVEPTDTATLAPVNQAAFITLNDILMQGNDVAPFSKEEANHTLMGRFGNTMLINGTTNYTLSVHQGDVVRFNFVNTANTRIFRVTIPGAKMKLVGGDNGWYQKEIVTSAIILSPSERAIVDVQFSKAGSYAIKNETPAATYTLGMVNVDSQKSSPDLSKEFIALRTHVLDSNAEKLAAEYQTKLPSKQINLTIDMPGMNGMHMQGMMNHSNSDGIEWEDTMGMMNSNAMGQSLKWVMEDKETGEKNMGINYQFKQGDKVKIRLFNDPDSMHAMQHTIHFHGNRFLVLATNGQKNTNLVWKDSVLVPAGATVDILLDASNPGSWMAHCHIAEHLQASMMINYNVQ